MLAYVYPSLSPDKPPLQLLTNYSFDNISLTGLPVVNDIKLIIVLHVHIMYDAVSNDINKLKAIVNAVT